MLLKYNEELKKEKHLMNSNDILQKLMNMVASKW